MQPQLCDVLQVLQVLQLQFVWQLVLQLQLLVWQLVSQQEVGNSGNEKNSSRPRRYLQLDNQRIKHTVIPRLCAGVML